MAVAHQTELTSKSSELVECKRELAQRPTVEDVVRLRQQLSVLQTLYFNVEDAEGGEQSSGTASTLATPIGTVLLGIDGRCWVLMVVAG